MFFSLLFLLTLGFAACGMYRLIVRKIKNRKAFDDLLKIAGILMIVLFFVDSAVSLITIFQVDKQLGFSYATPDTPEGELF